MTTQTDSSSPVNRDGNPNRDKLVEQLREEIIRSKGKGRPHGRALAARIRARLEPGDPPDLKEEVNSLAGAIGNCGECNHRLFSDMTELSYVFHCGRPILCWYCAKRRAKRNARDDAKNLLMAHYDNPKLTFMMLTLTVPTSDDLEEQLALIREALRLLPNRRRGAWSNLNGLIWQIELDKGLDGKWRSHVHAIACAEDPTHDFRFELQRQWVDQTHPSLQGSELSTALRRQDAEVFWTHHYGLLSKEEIAIGLSGDAFRVSKYAGKDCGLDWDSRIRAFALNNGGKLRQVTGGFWNLPKRAEVTRPSYIEDALKPYCEPYIRIETKTPRPERGSERPFMRYLGRAKERLAYRRRRHECCFGSTERAGAPL